MKLQLERNPLGHLALIGHDGVRHEPVVPVRAFPIQDPEGSVSLVGADGHEKAWIDRLSDLASAHRALVEEDLRHREFMPVIQRLVDVSSFATPSTWTVDTDRGRCQFVLKGEEDIRRLNRDTLVVLDSHGVQFMIRQPQSLDKHSRKLLDRFL
jgi:Domain of unknown function (DUF1854)